MAAIIDGKAVAKEVQKKIKEEVEGLERRWGMAPGLAVVLVGDDPASHIYVRNKEKACKEVGIKSFEHLLPATISERELLALVQHLNKDKNVHGILVQLPLPPHIRPESHSRSDFAAQRYRRFSSDQPGNAVARRRWVPAMHADGSDETPRGGRLRSQRQKRRGGRPQQYRRQTGSADAARETCHGDHLSFAHDEPARGSRVGPILSLSPSAKPAWYAAIGSNRERSSSTSASTGCPAVSFTAMSNSKPPKNEPRPSRRSRAGSAR